MTQQVLDAVWDSGQLLYDHGNCFFEWLGLVYSDWDDVDRFLLDFETNGGG